MSPSEPHLLLAAIDMGSSSFKLFLAHHNSHKLTFIDRLSSPVTLAATTTSGELSDTSIQRSISALRFFSLFLSSRHPPVHPTRVRLVATSAVRSASNSSELVSRVKSELDFDVQILSGEEEARLMYLGILQFLPVYHKQVLAIDIGGGSTEFVVGLEGKILFSASLNLGHVTLTEVFLREGTRFDQLRSYIREVLRSSGLVEKVKELGFEVTVGSSGTVKSIEKAICNSLDFDFERKWKFARDELESLVEKIEENFNLGLGIEGVRRLGFTRRRAEFIVAGAILLREIFEVLGVQEMEVSGYALGEGVIAEMMMDENGLDLETEFDLSKNARWRSVVGLAVRFDGENRMKSAVKCVGIAKDIFDGVRKYETLLHLDCKDFEYTEAAILLHYIGRVVGKKGHHKVSYQIIKNGGHLHGYCYEEIEFIALLVRFHKKSFPKYDHGSLQELPMEMKEKFRVLCMIVRLSLVLHQFECLDSKGLEIVHVAEGFEFILKGTEEKLLDSSGVQSNYTIVEEQLRSELEHFEEVFGNKISIVIL